MPPVTPPNPVEPVQPIPNVNVNVGGDGAANNGFMGLTGWARTVAQFSAVVLTYALATGFLIWMVHTMREDRRDDRAEWHQVMDRMNDEQNRRAGDIKGAVDFNSKCVQELSQELKAMERQGILRPGMTMPRPTASPP